MRGWRREGCIIQHKKVCFVRHHRYWIEQKQQQQTNKHFASLLFCLCLGHDKRTLFWKTALAATKDKKYQRRLFLSGMEIILHMTHAVRVQPLCYFRCCLLTTTPHVASSACSRCAWLTSLSVLFSLSAVEFTVFTEKRVATVVDSGASNPEAESQRDCRPPASGWTFSLARLSSSLQSQHLFFKTGFFQDQPTSCLSCATRSRKLKDPWIIKSLLYFNCLFFPSLFHIHISG